MASKFGSASAANSSPVCCMCGDHGLAQQLFQCKLCLHRSQHKYCSDLYPKGQVYNACNWCLREKGTKLSSKETTKDSNSSISSFDTTNDHSTNHISKLRRGGFSSQLDKPVKKLRLVNLRRGRQMFRGQVRRYKLLEEVSS